MAVPKIPIIFATINYHSITIDMKTIGCLQLSDDGKTLENCTDKSVISVEIPDGVAVIGDWAFRGCTRLTSMEISGSVTKIGYAAFSGCTSLISIEIPSSVTEIGDNAFSGCALFLSNKKRSPNQRLELQWYPKWGYNHIIIVR